MEANIRDPDQTLGIYGLKCNYFAYLIRVAEVWEVYC